MNWVMLNHYAWKGKSFPISLRVQPQDLIASEMKAKNIPAGWTIQTCIILYVCVGNFRFCLSVCMLNILHNAHKETWTWKFPSLSLSCASRHFSCIYPPGKVLKILSEALRAVMECSTVGHFLGISQYLRPAEWRRVHRRGNGFLAGDAVLIYTLCTCKAAITELFSQMTIKMGIV